MSYRQRTAEFEEQDYAGPPPPRRSDPRFDDDRLPPRAITRSPPPPPRARAPVREYEEDVRVREREREREGDGMPAFLREDYRRGPPNAGPIVLRRREVETFDRHERSPSPPPRPLRRPRSNSPPPPPPPVEHERTRIIEKERVRSPSPRMRAPRSPSPRIRFERRPRSPPSPVDRESIRTKIVERDRERYSSASSSPSRSSSPPPPRPIVRGPVIEREVITHYRDIDHGVAPARRPSPLPHPPPPPPPARPRGREHETDIDISLSKNRTEVDIRETEGRPRSRSRDRHRGYRDDELVIHQDSDRLRVDEYSGPRRRARSMGPVEEEADYITSRIDSRGRMGEAWGGATTDWSIVDVPPGTERVRMDGKGGGATDTTWSRYSGVRRTAFNPERDGVLVARESSPAPLPAPIPDRGRDRGRDRLSVSVVDRNTEIDVETSKNRRLVRPGPPPPPSKEMWTEITKDLVVREAIEQLGYEYEETQWYFYIMEYLRSDDVFRLTQLSDRIRRARKERVREIQWERDFRDDVIGHRRPRPRHDHHHHHRLPSREWDDEVVREREVIYDHRGPARGYLR